MTTKRAVGVLVPALAAIVVLRAGCTFDPVVGTRNCTRDTDCPPGCTCFNGWVCVPGDEAKTCIIECDRDEDCRFQDARAECVGHVCVLAGCDDGFADCNGEKADGCETDITGDEDNCGRCDHGCALGKWCLNGTCTPCDTDTHCGLYCHNCEARPRDRVCVEGACGCLEPTHCANDEVCLEQRCQACAPTCEGKCGGADDGCGGVCDLPCPAGSWCDGSACVVCDTDAHCGPACTDCTGQANDMACVEGGCGCRTGDHCANGESCLDSKCTGCTPDCANKCGGAPDGCGGSCNGACPPGYWCEEGACRACDQDDHCGPACVDCTDAGTNGVYCSLDQNAVYGCACRTDQDCLAGTWCDTKAGTGLCKPCDQDDHCGASCQNCASSRDGKVCIDGRCGCYTEFDCGPGARCEDQRCIAQDEPRPDGGLLDGDGAQDAGADAGHDAGVDAGTDVGADEEADGW